MMTKQNRVCPVALAMLSMYIVYLSDLTAG